MRRLPGEGKPKPEAVHAKAQRPKMPAHLTGAAAEKWKELCKSLHRRGVLTRADGTQLEMICAQYANWVALQKVIATEGVMVDTVVLNSSGEEVSKTILNPALKAATLLENSMRAGLQQIGSTPASREKSRPAKLAASEQPLPADSVGAMAGSVLDAMYSKKKNNNDEEVELDDVCTDILGSESTGGEEGVGDE